MMLKVTVLLAWKTIWWLLVLTMATCLFGQSPMEEDAIAPSTDPFISFVVAMTEESIASVVAMTNRRLFHVVTTE